MWIDIFDNYVKMKTTDLALCDKMQYSYKAFYFNLAAKFGFRNCHAGVYDYLVADPSVTYTCAKQYTTIKNLIDANYGPNGSGDLLVDTCTVKPVEFTEPVEVAQPVEVPVVPV